MALRRYVLSALLALLAACGGGGSAPVVAPAVVETAPAQPAPVVLFQQVGTPTLVTNYGTVGVSPYNAGFVATFDLGPIKITWDERGLGMVIDSWTAPEGSSPIKTANYSWLASAPVRPWADGSNTEVCTSFTASVPQSDVTHGSMGNYVGGDIWLRDGSVGKATSGKILIISTFVFDHDRPPMGDNPPGDYIVPLNAVHFGGPIGTSKRVRTTSGEFHTQPWSEPERFGFCVNRDQVLFMLAASVPLFGGMADIHDMTAMGALISSEEALPGPSTRDRSKPGATLTTYFSDWTVTIEGARP